MPLRKVVDALAEPVTLAEAKAHLNVFDTSRDAYITALITAARQTCEGLLGRTLVQTDYELTLDYFPYAIPLRMPRVISVTAVKYIDGNGTQQTLSSSSYQVDDRSEPGAIVPAYGFVWPLPRYQINAVTVTYRCGYGIDATTVPDPIKQWIKLLIGTMFANREADVVTPGVVAVHLGFADRLLDPYRVLEP